MERVTTVTHTLHGQELAIDKATPKDRGGNTYLAAAAARNVSQYIIQFQSTEKGLPKLMPKYSKNL